jgi:hypothetical protein
VTKVLAVEPMRYLELDARLWPFGAARVRIELTATEPNLTEVRMSEEAVRGPARILPAAAQAPLLIPRNRESLARLAHLAAGRDVTTSPPPRM